MVHQFLWAATPQRTSIVDRMRTIALKLEFGISHNQTFEKYCNFLSTSQILILILHFSPNHINFLKFLISNLFVNTLGLLCRTLAVHFTDPFHVSIRVADKCNDGTLLLQVFNLWVQKNIPSTPQTCIDSSLLQETNLNKSNNGAIGYKAELECLLKSRETY